ncbi:Hypothetical protein, putative [Bodo saltans]|uniref:Uncharacterized protein n=1 Tax=Bodo saltans TaxID=75058 RepID=A0A0S4JFQ0_BODSA|nr:Hypothetical protein, putative [Bodo saltans]|eukprot:CUG88948.1 Hypothetical protein, putative [Bodo saltans]
MGCSSSKCEAQLVDIDPSVLGRCWETPHTDGHRVESHWLPFNDSDNGQRPNYAFTLSGSSEGRGSTSPHVYYAQHSFLKEHHLGVRKGIEVKVHNTNSMDAVSSDTILQSTERGVGGNVSVSGTMISLGAEFTRVRSAGPGRRSMFLVVVVKLFELELVPSQAKERGYVQHEVDVDISKKNVREQFGEGIITQVLYGGYLVIDIEQENYAAMRDGFVAMGKVGASPAGGGEVGARFAKSKTEGAKAFNSSVRRVGGDPKLVPPSFTNAPIEKVLATIEKWMKDLKKNPHKAAPISLYLQTYPGIIRHIKRHPKNILTDAEDEVNKRIHQQKISNGGGSPAYVAPYNKFYNGPVASSPAEHNNNNYNNNTGGISSGHDRAHTISGIEQWPAPHQLQQQPHLHPQPSNGYAVDAPPPPLGGDAFASPLGYADLAQANFTYPPPLGGGGGALMTSGGTTSSQFSSGGSDHQHHHHLGPSQAQHHGVHLDAAALQGHNAAHMNGANYHHHHHNSSAAPQRNFGEQSLKTPVSHDDLHSPTISPPHIINTPNPKPLGADPSFLTPAPPMEPLDGHTQPPFSALAAAGSGSDPLGEHHHTLHDRHPPPLHLGDDSTDANDTQQQHQQHSSSNQSDKQQRESILSGSFDSNGSPQHRQMTGDFSEPIDQPASTLHLAEYADKTSGGHQDSVVLTNSTDIAPIDSAKATTVVASGTGDNGSHAGNKAQRRTTTQQQHVDPTSSATGSPIGPSKRRNSSKLLEGEDEENTSDITGNGALISFAAVSSSIVSGTSTPTDSTYSSPVVADPTNTGGKPFAVTSDTSSDGAIPVVLPGGGVTDLSHMRPSRSIAQRLEDNEALWHITSKELSAMKRELAEIHAVTETMQTESDALETNLRTLRYTFFPDLDSNAADATLDFLEYYLNDMDNLPETEKDLDNAASWLSCAAVLLQHPRSQADVLSIHVGLNDDDAHVLAGYIRGASHVVCRSCTRVNLANNELRSQGAASVLRACIECAAAAAADDERQKAAAVAPDTVMSSSGSSRPVASKRTEVDLVGNFLQSSFGAHVPEYTEAVKVIKETYPTRLALLVD